MTGFIEEHMYEIGAGSLFVVGFSIYSYFKVRGMNKEEKLVYYSVRDLVREQKKAEKQFNESIGGSGKGEKFFK